MTLALVDAVPLAPPFTRLDTEISLAEDWNRILPGITDSGVAYDLTGKVIEIYVRPNSGHATLIKKLSTATGEIVVASPGTGAWAVYMTRADVIAAFPVGRWRWFALLKDGSEYFELFRGEFHVHGGPA